MLRSHLIIGSSYLALLAAALPAPDLIDDETLQCLSSNIAWESASVAWSDVPPLTRTVTSQSWGIGLDENVAYTTLCDGRPRAVETIYTTIYTTYDPPMTYTEHQEWTVSSPSCTITGAACTSLLSSYSTALSEYQYNSAPWPTASAYCTSYHACKTGDSTDCRIYGFGGNLYYWPVQTVSGDFCLQNGSTIFAEPTDPPLANTAVVDGHTFTSPTNYAQFSVLQAYTTNTRGRRAKCGTTSYQDPIIVPLTETFSSFSGWESGTGIPASFNFEDFNTIPVAAWEAQKRCRDGDDCTTISGEYLPVVPLPTEVLNLQPKEWKEAGCQGRSDVSGGYYMTPKALVTPAPTAAGKWLL